MRWILTSILSAALAATVWVYVVPHRVVRHAHLAPDGTFFLLERVTKSTDFGVYSLPPGSEVHRVSQQESTVTVSDGHVKLDLDSWLLTNDLDIAASLVKEENGRNAGLQSTLDRQKRAIQEEKNRIYQEHAAKVDLMEQQRASQRAAPNPLDRSAYHQQHDVASRPILRDPYGYHYWVDRYGAWHYEP